MTNKIGRFFAWLFVAVLGLFWLRRDAKQDQKGEQAKEVLERVEQAKKVSDDVRATPPGERRQRLRDGRK